MKKPVAIFSKILNCTIYLTEDNLPGKPCYNAKEVGLLKEAETKMTKAEYEAYLKKIHLVKTAFDGSKIESVDMKGAPPPEKEEKDKSEPEAEPEWEPKQGNLWEL